MAWLMDSLNLNKERIEVENEVIVENNSYNIMIVGAFKSIFNDFAKYGKYVNYDINRIDTLYEELKYEMTEEEVKCNQARISIIMEKVA